ncbi:MAG: polyamine aminopropyltransferase [Chloroflexota bacterium]
MSIESGDPDNPDKANWFRDALSPDLVQFHRVRGRLYSGRTRFQSVDVIETGGFGRCLVLDGRVQSTEGDEFIYHEALVQPAMLVHPGPRSVLIAGGGEGATLRQVLLHSTVTRAVMVDIDEEVIRVSREYLPSLHGGSFDDPRAELVMGDARKYIETGRRKFDVIVLDLPEALEQGPARLLYTHEFYSVVQKRLEPGGILALQADNASWGCLNGFPAIINTLKSVFPVVRPYQAHIPSFGGSWGFATASQGLDPLTLSAERVDRVIAERRVNGLRFYDGLTHVHLFSLPKHLRNRLDQEQRAISDAAPLSVA